jgi:amino acid transporter
VVSVVVSDSGEEVEVGTTTDAMIVVEAEGGAADVTVSGLGPSFDCPGPATIGPGGAASTSSGRVRNPKTTVGISLMLKMQ